VRTIKLLVTICFWLSVSASAQDHGVVNHQRVPANTAYHRVWVVSPLIGTGKVGDPKRPMFVLAPVQMQLPQNGAAPSASTIPSPPDRSGSLGYQMQLSDDGKSALIEFVFASPVEFQSFLQKQATALGITVPATATVPTGPPSTTGATSPVAAPSPAQTAIQAAVPGLLIFERGKATDQQILTAFQKYKTNFTFGSSTVRPQ
jgi:hypothetical protein